MKQGRRDFSSWLMAVALMGASGMSGVAQAEGAPAPSQATVAVLHRLTPYDTRGERSFQALQTLSRQAVRAPTERERQLNGFLHATASVDLWLIAMLNDDAALMKRLSEAFGAAPEALPQALAEALRPLRQTRHRMAALDALEALRLLSAPLQRVDATDSPRGEGSRAALALLHVASTRASGVQDPVAALAPLGEDPCSAGDGCEGLYAYFDAPGRAAVAAFERVAAGFQKLSRERAQDPLIVAVMDAVAADYASLRELRLVPGPKLGLGPSCHEASCGEPARVDVLAYVDGQKVRVGFAPGVRIGTEGVVELSSAGTPVWPQTRELELPASYPGYLRHVDRLAQLFAEMHAEGASPGSIGVSASPRTPAHVWARVMLSARAARYEALSALATAPGGDARMQPVRVVTPFGAARLAPSGLSVIVLHHGYALTKAGRQHTIERRLSDKGAPEFDLATLVERAGPLQGSGAYLRFVPNVGADALLSTAFALGPPESELTVILP